VKVYPGLSEALGEEITLDTPVERLREIAAERGVAVDPAFEAGKIVMELFGELVEPTLLQPTFVCDYPAIAQPLARPHRDDPRMVEAWDLIIGGMERGTGFSELVDPVISARCSPSSPWPRRPGTRRRCSSTRTSWRLWSSAAPRWAAWGWGSTGW
jgi:lysyl-tRNA synthetase class 2